MTRQNDAATMKNIEIKVRVERLEKTRRLALEFGATPNTVTHDTDTYFRVLHGRLKLRVSNGELSGTLIRYERPDESTSRVSDYQLVAVSDVATLGEALVAALGVLAVVKKTRELLVYGATRIHLDEVEGLGSFVELETVIDQQSLEHARSEHQLVYNALQLNLEEIIPLSYSDLLLTDEREES